MPGVIRTWRRGSCDWLQHAIKGAGENCTIPKAAAGIADSPIDADSITTDISLVAVGCEGIGPPTAVDSFVVEVSGGT